MKLSVIIVNYNVKFFLEQCLHSVLGSLKELDAEVIVVDNNSVDGSEAMVRLKFPSVHLLVNHSNVGFSKANNQAISIARGEYILLLNPDTVLEETTLTKCVRFMDEHRDAGALGPKMIDGKGNFLPESKRGLPTPLTAFYKIFGLAKLFPKSPRFNRYYLGNTNPEDTQEVDVLTGAFLLMRKETLNICGLLDEEYFMYGEDIDLSYRIQKTGYKNYYFPETTIIHYKGESTKKGSLNYIVIFYKAMDIFARKHFSGKMAAFFHLSIRFAILLRALLSILKRAAVKGVPLVLDFSVSYIGIFQITLWWERFWFNTPGYYPAYFTQALIPAAIVVMLAGNLFMGGYKSPYGWIKPLKGILYGLVVVLIVYALLPSTLRFSRLLILFSAAWVYISVIFTRIVLNISNFSDYKFQIKRKEKIAVVGNEPETQRITEVLRLSGIVTESIMLVSPKDINTSEIFCGTISQLHEIIEIYKVTEIIFSAKDISSEAIIEQMKRLSNKEVNFKIAPPESVSVIGSNSSNTSGDFYTVQPENKLEKKKIIRDFSFRKR